MKLYPKSRLNSFVLLFFYLGLGMASTMIWTRVAALWDLGAWHADMISSTAPAPNQYRPLVPWLAEIIRVVLPGHNIFAAYTVLRSLVTGSTLYFFDRYLRTWFPPAAATGGALMLAVVLPFTYLTVIQESDPINLLVFTLAFWAMVKGCDYLLIPIMLFGTLNRETTAMLPAVYLLGNLGVKPIREVALKTAILVFCWCIVHGGLRLFYGDRSYYCDIIMWKNNIKGWGPSINVFLLFGMVWVLSLVGAKGGPLLLRRALLLLPFYLALHYVIALVEETRIFLPWAPVVIPLAWLTLFPSDFTGSDNSISEIKSGGP
jgi:hypothetical protein